MSESVDIKASGKLPDHQETESWDYYDDLDQYSDYIMLMVERIIVMVMTTVVTKIMKKQPKLTVI